MRADLLPYLILSATVLALVWWAVTEYRLAKAREAMDRQLDADVAGTAAELDFQCKRFAERQRRMQEGA